MRKLAQYRRNNHPNSGFKEKVTFQLSKRPQTGRELSAFFHVTLGEFNGLMRGCLRGKTAVIEAANPVPVDGCTDYTYTLISTSRITPARPQTMIISRRSLAERGEDKRQQHIEAAKRRARLIKKGINPGLFD
ncbi:hypothetical protein [Pantoea ananatis]|uniref:hypothetical protein n=1 Tax=Pantoea ananas TaxID=553 RepID=UPI00023233BA|nr:hypothetical protein [Pantoea ananatis]AER33632.1 putative regulatory protein [Pantoea ananatis PA13]